jgi:adenylate cyclase
LKPTTWYDKEALASWTWIGLLVLIAILWAPRHDAVGLIDRFFFDHLQQLTSPASKLDERFAVVLVDDPSLARLNERWPMARLTWARLLRRLSQAEPKVIAVDAWFENPAPRQDVELALDVADFLRATSFVDKPMGKMFVEDLEGRAITHDGDRQLAQALAEAGNVVLGASCLNEGKQIFEQVYWNNLPVLDKVVVHAPLQCGRISTSISQIASAAQSQAFLNIEAESDGVVRHYPLFLKTEKGHHPSFALGIAAVAEPEMMNTSFEDDNGYAGHVLLRTIPRKNFLTLSASDLLEGDQLSLSVRQILQNRIVLVGVSALGTEDFYRDAVNEDIPGVFLHATATLNILDQISIHSKDADGLHLLVLVALVVGLGLFRNKTGGFWRLNLLTAAAILVWGGYWVMLFQTRAWVGPSLGLIGIGGWWCVVAINRYLEAADAKRNADSIRKAFQHYLAEEVIKELVENPGKLALGGERRQITAFFSDVVNFTTLSEKMPPDRLIVLLNDCLGVMSQIILEEGGIIDKYVGDAIVAMFGAPVEQHNHAERAVRAALRCQEILTSLRPQWLDIGFPEINVRIGLNTGTALVGNMGSESRFDYTMLGDTVNLAARLESANKQYGTDVLVGEQTRLNSHEDFTFREIDLIQVKGKDKAARVFQPIRYRDTTTPEEGRIIRLSDIALAAYREHQFDAAKITYKELEKMNDPVSTIFLDRIEEILAGRLPPPDDGVFKMTSK